VFDLNTSAPSQPFDATDPSTMALLIRCAALPPPAATRPAGLPRTAPAGAAAPP
jgi:hypothetical protein